MPFLSAPDVQSVSTFLDQEVFIVYIRRAGGFLCKNFKYRTKYEKYTHTYVKIQPASHPAVGSLEVIFLVLGRHEPEI